jgi:hypothetical protein
LSFCRRRRVPVCKPSARDFIAQAQNQKRPSPERLERWKEAIRWFFRTAPREGSAERRLDPPPGPGAEAPIASGEDGRERLRRRLRVRHYSYRTEQTYHEGAERFSRFCQPRAVSEAGEADLKRYLEHLAVRGNVSASTQRQALNALVFLVREGFGKELGDFSDYPRGRARCGCRRAWSGSTPPREPNGRGNGCGPAGS